MTIAHRLVSTSGRAGFEYPLLAPDGDFDALPVGGWTIIPSPKAYYYNGRTFFGWTDGQTGFINVGGYDHASQRPLVVSTMLEPGSVDTHAAPAVMVRNSDKRLVVAYCIQGDTSVNVRISTNPEDTSSFGPFITAAAAEPGTSFTYVGMVQLRGVVNEPIYLFYTLNPSSLGYVVSTDGGVTWSAKTTLVTNSIGADPHIYWQLGTDWGTRIDVFCTDNVPTDSSLFHFYIDGAAGTYHKSDGTAISGLPFDTTDLTLVLDQTNGPCWSFGAAWDGAPACVIMQAISGSDNAVRVARWRGGAWRVDTVVASVGGQFAGDKYFSGCGIHPSNPDLVYIAEKSALVFEINRHTSADDGGTWVSTPITSSSVLDNVMPQVPVNQSPGLDVFWLTGTMVSAFDYNFAIRAYRQGA